MVRIWRFRARRFGSSPSAGKAHTPLLLLLPPPLTIVTLVGAWGELCVLFELLHTHRASERERDRTEQC